MHTPYLGNTTRHNVTNCGVLAGGCLLALASVTFPSQPTHLACMPLLQVLQQGGVHYLSDGTNPAVDGNMKPILALVAHSPDADAYKQLWRQVPGFMHTPAVLPPWETLDELLRLQPLHPHVSRAQVP